ncbi:Isopenicillin N synthase [Pseudoxanthobacter soli DSM 19599]|uniref:Isopenicillin N synthase n=1 Tax=Pseudoxanthobacter soli DSM 19599 TaxID=1123029 RepID=A0A1M7ZLF1_9HYPH|nr:2-oxoglutarate and iron-dependent oxygenase domain-containing protein [Pseudoxanthobacter soli]SHO65652.1 Isopenicillin N synthase [Pseudoxanthobacter soli DSM 19599]
MSDPSSAVSLPIVDLTPMREGRPGGTAEVAAQIGHAARGIGFFYLVGHGIAPEVTKGVFDAAATFFALPPAEKDLLSIKRSAHNRGYVAVLGESLDPSKPADLKEGFNIGLDLAADDPRVLAGEPFRGPNLWPGLPGWRETMLGYYDAVWRTGLLLHRAIAVDLGMPETFFDDKFDQPLATLRLLHYPPQPASTAPGQLGAGEHTDYGNLTLLLTDEVGGLEVRRRDGGWIAAPSIEGAFVCNIGDCLMRWTNDVYVSTPHRVVNAEGRERYSVPFFLDPNPDAAVVCLPTCTDSEHPPLYAPTTGAAYLKERLDATYAFRRPAAG